MGAGLSPGLADSDPGQLLADLLTSRNENAALKRSLALLRAVVDASGDLAYVKDEKGQYIVANEAMASLLDRSVSQLLGEDDKSLFPADFASQTMDHDRSVMAGNEAGTFEEIALLAGIKHRYISTRAPLRDEQGRVIGVVGISHDDSERFRAQESLKQSERRGDVILESITDGYLVVDRQWRFSQIDPRVQPLLGKGPSELIGKNCWDEFPEIIGTAFEIECRRAMEAGVAATFEAYFLVPLSRWFSVHAFTLTDGLLAYVVDVTERVEAEEAQRRYADRLAFLHESDRAILAARSPIEIAQAGLERLNRIIPLWRGGVGMIDLGNWEIEIFATIGAALDEFPIGTPVSLDLVPATDLEALCEDRVLIVDDTRAAEARVGSLVDLPSLGVGSYARIPLTTGGHLVGSLNLYAKEARAFDHVQLEVAREVADSLAIAIKQAQLFEEVRTSRERLTELSRRVLRAQEDERRRIAGDLHDEIGQALTAVKLNLEAMPQSVGPAPIGRLGDSIALVERTIEQIRGLSFALRPQLLDDLGLVPALRSYFRGMERRSGIETEFVVAEEIDRQDADVETACYRIAQEAMTNIVRHSGAKAVTIHLHKSGQQFVLSVADDGIGFDVSAATQRAATGASMGLLSMRERASLVGGHLVIRSTPGQGTVIRATVPLRAAPHGTVGTHP